MVPSNRFEARICLQQRHPSERLDLEWDDGDRIRLQGRNDANLEPKSAASVNESGKQTMQEMASGAATRRER